MPYTIDVDAKILIDCYARLGDVVKGLHEDYVPLIVTDLLKVQYDPISTLGPPDSQATQAGVCRLQR